MKTFDQREIAENYRNVIIGNKNYLIPFEEVGELNDGRRQLFSTVYAVMNPNQLYIGKINTVEVKKKKLLEEITAKFLGYQDVELFRYLLE